MIRTWIAALPLLALSACGGDTRPQTVGNNPPGGTPTPTQTNFLDVTSTTTFDVVGGFHALDTTTTTKTQHGTSSTSVSSLYTGNAATVNAPNGSISYSPRDGVFTLTLSDTTARVSHTYTYQDPAHRAQFTGAQFAQFQIPNLPDFNYLQVLDGNAQPVFFYQRPGSKTTFVSLAGFSRVEESSSTGTDGVAAPDTTTTTTAIFKGERGAFVFGQKTPIGQVPVSGSATYSGDFIASMVNDPTGGGGSYMQWITGTNKLNVDFGAKTASLALAGTVGDAFAQGTPIQNGAVAIASGSQFNAVGTAAIDLTRNGGFTGAFTLNTPGHNNVGFTSGTTFTGIDFASVAAGGSTAGASSIDGTFFGPNAVNAGGNFRIVGGIPNQRVDILGAFSGAKP
jgi:hypothetical protein